VLNFVVTYGLKGGNVRTKVSFKEEGGKSENKTHLVYSVSSGSSLQRRS